MTDGMSPPTSRNGSLWGVLFVFAVAVLVAIGAWMLHEGPGWRPVILGAVVTVVAWWSWRNGR